MRTIGEILKDAPNPLTWLPGGDGLFPATGVVLIVGLPESGKTTLATEILALMSQGRSIPQLGTPGDNVLPQSGGGTIIDIHRDGSSSMTKAADVGMHPQKHVFAFSNEESTVVLAKRAESLNADFNHFQAQGYDEGIDFDIGEHDCVSKFFDDHDGGAVLIDSLRGAAENVGSNLGMRKQLRRLRELSEGRGLVFIVHHLTGKRIADAEAILQICRHVLLVGRHPIHDAFSFVTVFKTNVGINDKNKPVNRMFTRVPFMWKGSLDVTAQALITGDTTETDSMRYLSKHMTPGVPYIRSTIVKVTREDTGASERTIMRARLRLGITTVREPKFSGTSIWIMPEQAGP